MEATGERYIPEMMCGQIQAEHMSRYLMVYHMINLDGKTVLDIASGSGYGTYLLSSKASRAYGVDVSQEAIDYSTERYKRNNLTYLVGNCLAIPLETDSVDVLVSFETIEHFDNHQGFMDEIKRVLHPGGVLVISSPNKRLYTDIPKTHNPYHVHELYTEEFRAILQTVFKHAVFFGQNYMLGSIIYPSDMMPCCTQANDIAENIFNPKEHLYDIAIASDEPIKLQNYGFPLVYDLTHTIEPNNHLYYQEGYNKCRETPSFRLGHALLHPFSLFRRK